MPIDGWDALKTFQTFGFSGGAASNNVDTALGPWYWYHHPELFRTKYINLEWQSIIDYQTHEKGLSVFSELEKACLSLEKKILQVSHSTSPLLFLGGDHSIAMGTWPAMVKKYSKLGLLWVDAHLDAHTPKSSVSKNFHGMPLARLLGLWGGDAVFSPEQVCVFGVRSYENAEWAHLQDLGVNMMMMDDIHEKGLSFKLKEALDILKAQNTHLAMSIDLDAFDPSDCPGVGCREPYGIRAQEFFEFFKNFAYHDFVAIEVAEFNPLRDIEQKTARWLPNFLHYLYG